MIARHLQERQFANWVLDPTDGVAVAHLNECDACRKEAVDFRGSIAAFREALLTAGEGRRLEWKAPAPGKPETRDFSMPLAVLTWAPRLVLATLVLAVTIMTYMPNPAAPPAPAQTDDQALLLSVDEALNRSVPQALAPAEFIVAEANQSGGTNQNAAQ
jgi:hypothetical protein